MALFALFCRHSLSLHKIKFLTLYSEENHLSNVSFFNNRYEFSQRLSGRLTDHEMQALD